VSADSATRAAQERYPALATALQRHLAWACDFATAGDLDSAIEALRDAHAASAELRSSHEHPVN
jgi:hypothetical protein